MLSIPLSDAQRAFEQVCAQDPIPLDLGLLWIAKDEDDSTSDCILDELDAIAKQIHIPDPSNVLDAVSRINQHLFYELRFQGDVTDYYNPQNSLIHKVLARRQGLPILLSIVYIEIARRLDVSISGVGFPQHFLVQPAECGDVQFFIDPFDKGAIVTEPDLLDWHHHWGIDLPFEQCIQPTPNREILLRVCHNLFYAHNRLHQCEGMLRAIHRLMILQPEMTQLHRTRSVILGKMQRYPESLDALETYMLYNPDAQDIQACQRDMTVLKQLCRSQ
jgi:regulator of sirC expression with transglutaminase-like and TPR domain